MSIYLMEKNKWELFEGSADSIGKAFKERNISIGADAIIGDRAIIGEGARIGEGASIASINGLLVIGPLGSRQAVMTAYMHEDQLMIGTGCFLDSKNNFLEDVEKVHGNNLHAQAYRKAVEFAEKFFTKK